MRKTAFVLGIAGGIISLFGAILVMLIAEDSDYFGTSLDLGWIGLPVALIGILGGLLVRSKPGAAAILMLVSSVIGAIMIEIIGVFSGILLIVSAMLALVSRYSKTESSDKISTSQ